MFLLEEIGVEIAMIASVVVAVLCLAYLTQLSVREQVYLWRLRRERRSAKSAGGAPHLLEERTSTEAPERHGRAATPHQRNV